MVRKLTPSVEKEIPTNRCEKIPEKIDIYDKIAYLKEGVLIRVKTVLKDEAHETGDFHLAGHVWIYNSKGEILLQKRSLAKSSFPGMWDISAAGHISAGEDIETGTLRELNEELGIDTDGKSLEMAFTYIEDVEKIMNGKLWKNNELNTIYVFQYDGKVEDLKMQESEVDELKFVPLEEFMRIIADPNLSKEYVLQRPEYYEQLFSKLKSKMNK